MSNWFCPACGGSKIIKSLWWGSSMTVYTDDGIYHHEMPEKSEKIFCSDCKRTINIVQPLPEGEDNARDGA